MRMRRCSWLGFVACVLVLSAADASAQQDPLHARVIAFATARWGACSARAVRSDQARDGIDIDLESTGDGNAIALVRTPCHAERDGAYTLNSTLLEVRGDSVTPISIASEDTEAVPDGTVYNASLGCRNGAIELVTGARDSNIGDVGWEATYRWDGRSFVLFERRSREGGSHPPDDVGEYPIVEPAARACFPEIGVASPGRARLRVVRPGGQRFVDFAIHDAGCAVGSRDTLRCEGDVEYGVVSAARHWVVLRLDGSHEREIARVRRSCAL
uniref:hypothetical protein n=1 Tax=Sandaracinus sp. TaxID=2024858 RepID=UPI0019D48DFE|nr:hypothetical protein [Sandaracinus sp.]